MRPREQAELLTDGIPLGAIQVPQDGQPIILFVDQQTTGGYPKIANVIAADMHRVGQLRPRDEVRFAEVTIAEAVQALREQEQWLTGDLPNERSCQSTSTPILGESEESLANGTDFELMRYITSANVACGGHAGDEHTMRQTLAAARKLKVAVGAHPGLSRPREFRTHRVATLSRGNRGVCARTDRGAGEDRGFAGHASGAREATWRAVSRRQQESRGRRSP